MIIYAQDRRLENPMLEREIKTMTGETFLQKMFPLLLTWLSIIAIAFFLIQFTLGGLKWIGSQGDKNKVTEAQKQITFAIFGLALVFLAYVVLRLLVTVFGLTGFENLQFTLPRL